LTKTIQLFAEDVQKPVVLHEGAINYVYYALLSGPVVCMLDEKESVALFVDTISKTKKECSKSGASEIGIDMEQYTQLAITEHSRPSRMGQAISLEDDVKLFGETIVRQRLG